MATSCGFDSRRPHQDERIRDRSFTWDEIVSGELPNFHPDCCEKVARIAAVANVFLLVVQVFILVAVSPTQCLGWQIPNKLGSSSLWGIVAIAAFGVVISVYRALTWKKFVQRSIYGEGEEEPSRFPPIGPREAINRLVGFDESLRKQVITDQLFLAVNVGWTLFCGFPLFLMLGVCVGWPKP